MGFIEPDTTSKDKGKDGKKRFSFDDLEFDEDKHLFTVNGEIIPSVTQILKREGFCPGLDFIDPWYLKRGSYVHKATELFDKGTLNEDSLSHEIMPYLES